MNKLIYESCLDNREITHVQNMNQKVKVRALRVQEDYSESNNKSDVNVGIDDNANESDEIHDNNIQGAAAKHKSGGGGAGGMPTETSHSGRWSRAPLLCRTVLSSESQ
jgi:hypothetical protein